MASKPQAAFLDFATLGPNVDTRALEAIVDVRFFDHSDPDEARPRLADVEIAIVNKSTIDGEAIRASKRLKLIALSGTGSDNVDLAMARQCGVAVALRAGEIGGAGIDVLATEPPRGDHPLLAADIPNLIVTPHVAWSAREARQRAMDQITENIAAYLRGAELRRLV